MKSISIITPIYNEEDVVEIFYKRLYEVLSSIEDIKFSICFVVDKSSDKTEEILRNLSKENRGLRVILMSSRFGHQQALMAGIEKSLESDAIIMMDGDMQHPPELIPKLINKFLDGYDVVYTIRNNTKNIKQLRKIAGQFYYAALKVLSSNSINENAADYRLISRRVAKVLSHQFKEKNIFLRGIFPGIGFKQIGITYEAEERAAGNSKYTISRMVSFAIAGILSTTIKPLHYIIYLGLIASLISLLFLSYVLFEYFIDRSIPSGWSTLAVLVLGFGGLNMLVLGIVGAYIGGIYEEVKLRPRYIVEEEINYEK